MKDKQELGRPQSDGGESIPRHKYSATECTGKPERILPKLKREQREWGEVGSWISSHYQIVESLISILRSHSGLKSNRKQFMGDVSGAGISMLRFCIFGTLYNVENGLEGGVTSVVRP